MFSFPLASFTSEDQTLIILIFAIIVGGAAYAGLMDMIGSGIGKR